MDHVELVWAFNGAKSRFPSGIFTDLDRAERWIERHGLTATLTAYPLDMSGPSKRSSSGPASSTRQARSSSGGSRRPRWLIITTRTADGWCRIADMNAADEYFQMARCGSHKAAFHGLIDLGPQATPSLLDAYRTEDDPEVRALIVEVVRQHRLPSTLDFLADALDDPHPAVWKEALDSLVALATPEAEHRLRAVAGRLDAGDERRAWCEEAMEQITEAIVGRRL
jgi:HEAT repeat protein